MASSDVGNLCGGESDYVEIRVVSKYNVKVMKISSSSSQDEDSFHCCREASLDP